MSHHVKNPFFYILVIGLLLWQVLESIQLPLPGFPYEDMGIPLETRAVTGKDVGVVFMDLFPMERLAHLPQKPVSEWKRLKNIEDFRLPGDPVDHGTHVSGIVKRIAPEATLHHLSITADPYDVAYFMKRPDIDVINVSAYITGEWVVREFVEGLNQGKILVLAGGNDGVNLSTLHTHNRWILDHIAAINPILLEQVVIAINLNRAPKKVLSHLYHTFDSYTHEGSYRLHPSSNYPGFLFQDLALAAPGVDIESDLADGRIAKMTGTSMAAPVISGAIALLMEAYDQSHPKPSGLSDGVQNKKQRTRVITACLRETATKSQDHEPLNPQIFGSGILNIPRAIACVRRQ